MARYRNDMDDERDYYAREERLRRENFGAEEPYRARHQFDTERRPEYNREHHRGRFGERANYESDEPRYVDNRGERPRDDWRRNSLYEGRDFSSSTAQDREYAPERSRLRCRDIMTRDLAVATRDTTLPEVALMMKQEDTGVIPVVEYDVPGGNGKEGGTKIRRPQLHTRQTDWLNH